MGQPTPPATLRLLRPRAGLHPRALLPPLPQPTPAAVPATHLARCAAFVPARFASASASLPQCRTFAGSWPSMPAALRTPALTSRLPRPYGSLPIAAAAAVASGATQTRSYFWVTKEAAAASAAAGVPKPPIMASAAGGEGAATAAAAPPPILDPTLADDFSRSLDTTLTATAAPAADTAVAAATEAAGPALAAITQLGDLASLGLCRWTPVGAVEAVLEAVYVWTGLPWWGTIAAATLLARLLLFPITVKTQATAAKMRNLRGVLGPRQERLAEAQRSGDQAAARRAALELTAAYKAAGVSPLAGLWGLAQAPVFMSFFLGLRAMAELPVPGFETGGVLWFKDLTVADPTYMLPAIATGTMLVVLEYSMAGQSASTTQSQSMKNFFRFMTVIFVPIMASQPA
ncbi:Mitochondrial inner membrane protein oxa1l, partial [Cladochytrium tenue]